MDTAGRIDYSTLLIRKVRAGGAFDIDYRVTDPNRHVIFNGIREKQGDLFFTAKYAGEYSFCFSNNMSAVTEKTVDFQISPYGCCDAQLLWINNRQVENEPRAMLPERAEGVHEQTGILDEFLYKISNSFTAIRNSQKHLRLRESRNLSTVRSTETRIIWFSLVESFLIITVSLLQVIILKTFFTKTTIRV
ncbi:uncharacterized protein T551_00488 [Pneumocystis jirovecii RU7]|uniref:GOLD domain-containing protein n=1 Tax=Pneumocystis jirovecii (strain RU7) TaxID=1408657 RepID=A0A0W4ZVK0_PNEJ7|nr:uncharacterized protein T551_00488 [Pneumocystis jirovecii RU7]KTW32398.1 hypothetical protein T551_00488 [Pneumocystis jirovecii RU7]